MYVTCCFIVDVCTMDVIHVACTHVGVYQRIGLLHYKALIMINLYNWYGCSDVESGDVVGRRAIKLYPDFSAFYSFV